MIRVLYRFSVKPGQEVTFVEAWTKTTREISDQARGAKGSQLFRSRSGSAEFAALAEWNSFEEWQTFRQEDSPDSEAVSKMRSAAELISTEVWDEVRDLLRAD